MDNNKNSICIIDYKGKVLSVNQELLDLLKIQEKDIIGKNVFHFVSPDFINVHNNFIFKKTANDTFYLIPLLTKDNTPVYTNIRITHETYQGQEVVKTIIQEIKTFKEGFKIANKLLKYEVLIREITSLSSKTTSISDFTSHFLELAGLTFEVDHMFIYTYETDTNLFHLNSAWYHEDSDLKRDDAFSYDASRTVLQEFYEGKTHFSPDVSLLENKFERQIFEDIGIKAYINQPMFLDGIFYGFIGYNMTTTNRERIVDDITTMKSIAEIYTQTLSRIRINEKLKEREFFNRIQIENSAIGMAVIDAKTCQVLEYNNSLENVIGYSVEEFQNIDWFQISDPGELSEELKLEAQLFNRDIPNYSFDKSYIRKDGRKIYITVRKSIYWSEDNKPQYIIISFEDITAKTKFYKKIEYMSYHDELTGLYNRAFFENQVNDFEQTNKTNISIIMGDVNNLKLTNDIFGHYQGDKLLQIMADILTRVIGNHGIICRWAGDEFAAILPNTSESETQLLIQNILDECLLYQEEHESLMTKTDISLGYATKSSLTDTLYDVFSRAEQMMYRQKIIDSKRINYFSLESLEQTLVEKSKETTQHLDRLSHLAKRFGHYLNLSKDNIEKLELVAKIHDIGKIAIDNSVLNKPTSLSPQEWIEIKRHPEIGYRIARTNPNLIHVSDLILSHHERVDGRGYPRGLKSDQIPYLSKILLIMDAYDAMRYDRVYRDAMTMKEIIHELESNAGTQFDQKLVHKFIQFIQK